MTSLLGRLEAGETLCGDGAWGTQLMARGLPSGGCPESMNLTRPEVLAEIAELYLESGADLVTTNTFGGSPLKLALHGMDDRTEEINRIAVEVLRPVVAGRAHVSASVGPTGKILQPYGDTASEVVAGAFKRQIGALIEAGADVICVETMIDVREADLAVRAAREISTEVPVIATMTFEATPRGFFTTMGATVEQACSILVEAGADIVGSNCGNGIDTMLQIAREFTAHATVPLMIQSNAGMPDSREGELVYPESPEFMAERVGSLMELGVSIIGGCCGTTPDHIRALRAAIDQSQHG